jgi:hypothetical protein
MIEQISFWAESFASHLGAQRFAGNHARAKFLDIGVPEDYRRADAVVGAGV